MKSLGTWRFVILVTSTTCQNRQIDLASTTLECTWSSFKWPPNRSSERPDLCGHTLELFIDGIRIDVWIGVEAKRQWSKCSKSIENNSNIFQVEIHGVYTCAQKCVGRDSKRGSLYHLRHQELLKVLKKRNQIT